MLLANVLMQPIAGYLTDTVLPTRRYLALSIFVIVILAAINSHNAINPMVRIGVIIISAAFSYSFSQLMDAWVDGAKDLDENLIFSSIRAGGSIGFAVTSVLFGYIVSRFGYQYFFLIQAGIFLCLLPFLYFLPDLKLGNKPSGAKENKNEARVSFFQMFSVLLHNKKYGLLLLVFTLYWMGHRPIGSYLSLIIRQRGGADSLYGIICGIGAAAECLVLIFMNKWQYFKGTDKLIQLALFSSILRPILLLCFQSTAMLLLGQVMQSISFAFYFAVSVAAFSQISDARIKSLSIAVGLTAASVVGTIAANTVGGFFFDWFGAEAPIWMSIVISAGNLILYKMLGNQLEMKSI
jgi:MFS family permease